MATDQLIAIVTFTRTADNPVECGARQNMCLVVAIAHGLVRCTRLSAVLTALVERVDRMRPSIDDGMFIDHADLAHLMETLPTDAGGFVVYESKSAYSRNKCYATRVHTQVWDSTRTIIKILWEPIARATSDSTCDGHYLPVTDVARDDFDALLEMQLHDRMEARRVARNDALLRTKLMNINADCAYAMQLQDSFVDVSDAYMSTDGSISDMSTDGSISDNDCDHECPVVLDNVCTSVYIYVYMCILVHVRLGFRVILDCAV